MKKKFAYGITVAVAFSATAFAAESTKEVPASVTAVTAEEIESTSNADILERLTALEENGKQSDWFDKIKIGGRLQYDFTWADGDSRIENDLGKLEDGTEVRRARLYASGTLYDYFDFKLQFDWAGAETALKDAYLGVNNLPVYLKVGHFKEPFSLEELTSSKYVTFMERTSVVSAFAPSRNAGVQLSSTLLNKKAAWAAGIFRDTDNNGASTDEGAYAATARLTATPWYEADGERLFHMGAAGSYRKLPMELRYRARPPIHNTVRFVDTGSGTLVGDDGVLGGLEAALVTGPFSVQAELIGIHSELETGDDFSAMGWYAQASYFLTGEQRPYKQSSGAFGGVKPIHNYGDGGCGAWELALRYDAIDLNDGPVQGGELDNATAGINWYLNKAVRLSANYVYSDLAESGEAHFFGTRAQVAF